MPNKSNFNVLIDNGAPVKFRVLDDPTGFVLIRMIDGATTLELKLTQADSTALRNIFAYATGMRNIVPTT